MPEFYPHTFFEAAGGILCLAALIFGALSLIEGVRAHSLRVLAIFIVAALALFGNHISVYFAAVFIIATAVTELEFLQTLAAIIRGNKEYFSYKTSTMSAEEKLRLVKAELDELGGGKASKAANENLDEVVELPIPESANASAAGDEGAKKDIAEINIIENSVDSSTKISIDNQSNVHAQKPSIVSKKRNVSRYAAIAEDGRVLGVFQPGVNKRSMFTNNKLLERVVRFESLALDYIQELYGYPIQRDVVLKAGDQILAVDGVMKFPEKSKQPDEIFEVKYLSDAKNFHRLLDAMYKLPSKLATYASITKRVPTCQLVIVLDGMQTLTDKQLDQLSHAVHVTGLTGYHVLNNEDLESF
ncbi:hypothetical protein SAMN04490185_4195 [Pseudomonas frederiksbergensis]|uniref:Uncharacterized protein n=1 Tax=Pseudomonas frederiksbergensis TaxID=104087 RepID=A0A1H5DJA9_9PSED|nr:hypothetical protein [Pseudomonas frederiksbergensis]SED78901.1 hypothetical protein SAMN04490185_4195 [Pseudomonas frederiksbergensis]